MDNLAADLSQAVLRQSLVDRLERMIKDDLQLSMADEDDLRAVLLAVVAKRQADERAAREAVAAKRTPTTPRRAAGRPRKLKSGPNGRTDTLMATLEGHPGLPLGDLAKATYGTDDETSRNRTRSLLASLKKRKPPRVRNTGTGKWEVIPAE